MSQHVSMLVIDALAAGQLPAGEAETARTHITGCARCRDDLAQAEASVATFKREVFSRTVDKLTPTPWWRKLAPLLVPVVAAAVLLLWVNRKSDTPSTTGEDDIRVKGAVTFQVFAKRGDAVVVVRDREQLSPGDAIRFVAGARTERFLLVASVDGSGKATVYFPYGGTRSGAIDAAPVDLPGSIVLDRAPGPERIFALFSTAPVEAETVTRALTTLGARGGDAIRAAHALDVPGVGHQATLVFEKELP